MSVQKLRALKVSDASWKKHLSDSYINCRGEHTSSWVSWAKTRMRSGNRADTAVNSAGQVSGAAGMVTGAMALPGAATAGAMAGMTVAAASTLYALPAVIAVGAIAYWGYNKNEHNKVNKEIWDYWKGNPDKFANDGAFELDTKKLMRWLGWFGDEGIANMNHLGAKNTEAKTAFDKKFTAVRNERNALAAKVAAFNKKPPVPPAEQAKHKAEFDALQTAVDKNAQAFIDLGKDLQYITYRVERFVMYHEMLDLTVRSVKKTSDLTALQTAAATAMEQQRGSYEALYADLLSVPPLIPPRRA